jgi:hypothetical protein
MKEEKKVTYKVKKENILKLLLFIKEKENKKEKDDKLLFRGNSE